MTNNNDQGFLLLPLLVFLALSSLLILIGTHELSQSYRTHQIKLHLSCHQLLDQLGSEDASSCPPCPLAEACAP